MKKYLSMFLIFALVLSISNICFAADAADEYEYIYVSPNGNDNNSGEITSPLKTLSGARDKIRLKKSEGISPEKGFVVYFREGDYRLTESVNFTQSDSGKENAHIVFRSYPNEKATFVGGASISAKDFVRVTDKSVLDKIPDASARQALVSLDLKTIGVDNVGEVYLNGSYSYTAPLPTEKPTPSPELFFNDEIMQIAKYPNDGYMEVNEVIDIGYQKAGVVDSLERGNIENGFVISVTDERVKNWKDASQALLYGNWFYEWADSSVRLKSVDAENNYISSEMPSVYGVKKAQKFYIYNLLEEIDVPGEYFIDRQTNILYFYPKKPLTDGDSIRLSLLENNFININGASYIDFKDLKFTGSRKSVLCVTNGKNINLIDSEIEYTAETAVQYLEGARNCGVINCYIHDVNGGVVLRGGIYDTLENGECFVENCEIERFSRLTKNYTGAVTLSGVGNRVSYNEIHDAPHLAILFGGNNNIIEYNEIYDVLQEADDSGAIYGGQSWVGRGLQIRYNYIHDCKSNSKSNVGKAAVYLDGGQCRVDIIGNIVVDFAGSAFWVNGGRNNNVINNIALNCAENVYFTDIMTTGILPLERMLNGIKNYPWQNPESEPWKNAIWKKAYPEFLPSLEDEPLVPKDNYMKNNLSVNTEPTKFYGNGAAYLNESGNFTINRDPGFVDMARNNYLLKADSMVYKNIPGFVAPPFEKMGRYNIQALSRAKSLILFEKDSPYALVNSMKIKIDESDKDEFYKNKVHTYDNGLIASGAMADKLDDETAKYLHNLICVN